MGITKTKTEVKVNTRKRGNNGNRIGNEDKEGQIVRVCFVFSLNTTEVNRQKVNICLSKVMGTQVVVILFSILFYIFEALHNKILEVKTQLNYLIFGLPWWSGGEKSVYQCRGHGFDSWSGMTSPASGASKPAHHNNWSPSALEPILCNKRRHRNQKPVHRNEREAHACRIAINR